MRVPGQKFFVPAKRCSRAWPAPTTTAFIPVRDIAARAARGMMRTLFKGHLKFRVCNEKQ